MSLVKDLERAFSSHRQEHQPDTGSSRCTCGGWVGPYTMTIGEGSYAHHLAQVSLGGLAITLDSLTEDRELMARAGAWFYSPAVGKPADVRSEAGRTMVGKEAARWLMALSAALRETATEMTPG